MHHHYVQGRHFVTTVECLQQVMTHPLQIVPSVVTVTIQAQKVQIGSLTHLVAIQEQMRWDQAVVHPTVSPTSLVVVQIAHCDHQPGQNCLRYLNHARLLLRIYRAASWVIRVQIWRHR